MYLNNMFRSLENPHSFFRISCADWEYICLSESSYDACVTAVKEMIKLKGHKLNISFTLICDKLLDMNLDREFFYCPLVLSDAGFKDLAKKLDACHDFLLDTR